jgi:hypothetical protein
MNATMSGCFARPLAPGLGLVALVVGCGASLPGVEAGVYRDSQVAFRVGEVPAGWAPVHVERANVAYRDEAHRASVLVDGRCQRKDDDVPLLALTDHLIAGTTERTFASQDTIPFDGREALHSRLTAKLDGVPMDYDLYVFKKDDCVFDLVYVGEPAVMDGGVAGFERFVAGFHTLAVRAP